MTRARAATIAAAVAVLGACGADDVPIAYVEQTTTTEAPTTTSTTEAPTTADEATTTTEAPVTTVTHVHVTTSLPAPVRTTVATTPEPEPVRGDAPLACIRSYEQGADGYATDTGNGFYGAYQFDRQTWQSVGGSGNPAHASPAEQDMRAEMLYDRRGLQPWPTPSRMCS